MTKEAGKHANGRLPRWLAVVALLAVLIAGCGQLREVFMPSAPGVTDEWAALLDEIRTFERRIGFRETDNFFDLSHEQEAFPFCGYASRFYLPYSYEDPAIRWLESVTEQECRELGHYADAYFGAVEVLGESGTPVTPAMITGKLDRFLYLVMHEDCHDQFDLPYATRRRSATSLPTRRWPCSARKNSGLAPAITGRSGATPTRNPGSLARQ